MPTGDGTSNTTFGSGRCSIGRRMSGVGDVLADFGRACAEVGCRWMLIGAQAVTHWGGVRATEDIDVTVEVDRRVAGTFFASLERHGFVHRYPEIAADLLARGAVFPLRHVKTAFEVDVVLAGSGLEALALAVAVPWAVGEVEVPVAHPTHLVVMKILAGRGKDLDDVRALLATGRVDLAEVRDLLGQLEAALGQSDLLPLLDSTLTVR